MELSRDEVLGNTPPGWLQIMRLIWDILEQWQAVAELTGEPRPHMKLWTRAQYDPSGMVSYPWIEYGGLGPLDDFEFDQIEKLSRCLNRLPLTCEACGRGNSRKYHDPRPGGGALYLCEACHPVICADLKEPLRNNVGAPFEHITPSEQYRLSLDDRPWTPGKDREDDARDGLLDDDEGIPF